ncbi:MAG TPA: sigma-E factor negative regulatory protein [Steroidobacteraceae bacterium]|nr:sigma-E factor negative regulatory protein [Steroidobacteraceae bacterium]
MSERIKEQLSAFLDGELPEPESALLLKRLERDDELRGALSRYSLIGAVLRHAGDVPAARQVAARVSAVIAREPAGPIRAAAMSRSGAVLRALAGVAVAAGVAAVALLLAEPFSRQDPVAQVPVLAQVEYTPVEAVSSAPAAGEAPARLYTTPPAGDGPGNLPAAEFANYLVAHSSYASPLVRRSVVAGLIVAPDPGAAQDAPVTENRQDGQ